MALAIIMITGHGIWKLNTSFLRSLSAAVNDNTILKNIINKYLAAGSLEKAPNTFYSLRSLCLEAQHHY